MFSTYRSVELDSKDGVAVAVVAYFRALLVVAHDQLPATNETTRCSFS